MAFGISSDWNARREGFFKGVWGPAASNTGLKGAAIMTKYALYVCSATFGILSVATASSAVTTEAPRWRHRLRGGIQVGPSGP